MRVNLPILVAVIVGVILLGGSLLAGEPLWFFLFALYVLTAILVNPWLLAFILAVAVGCVLWFHILSSAAPRLISFAIVGVIRVSCRFPRRRFLSALGGDRDDLFTPQTGLLPRNPSHQRAPAR